MRFCIRVYRQASLEGWHSAAACLLSTFIGSHRKNNRPLGLSSASLPSPFAQIPADIGGSESCINKLASSKKNLVDETPLPPIHPTPTPTKLGPQLPTEQLWPLVGCECIGCCHGDRGTFLFLSRRSRTEWVFPCLGNSENSSEVVL